MAITKPTIRRRTIDDYHRAIEAGVFGPEERLELINTRRRAKTASYTLTTRRAWWLRWPRRTRRSPCETGCR